MESIPEHLRQTIDLLTAILRRITQNELDISNDKSLYMTNLNRRTI